MSTATARPRREPRGDKSERRVEALLHAAREVFAEKGFEKATALEIAQRSGVSEATVFSYFGGKRDLCLEVIRRWYDEISTELERELPLRDGLPAQLQFAMRQHLEHLVGEGAGLCALVLGEGRVADAPFREAIAAMKRRYVKPLMTAIQAARDRGEVRADLPARLMRDLVYGPMEHVLWDFVASGRRPDVAATSRQLADLVLAAFAPPDAPLAALRRLQADVGAAVRRFDDAVR
jgi:AcrR family transcriptional regulator